MSSPFQSKAAAITGQLVASIMLLLFLPALLFTGLFLRANSDEPILLTDEVLAPGGTWVCIHRFRTTGAGNNAFHATGRILRSIGYDDLPALWDVVRGRVGLMQLYRLVSKA